MYPESDRRMQFPVSNGRMESKSGFPKGLQMHKAVPSTVPWVPFPWKRQRDRWKSDIHELPEIVVLESGRFHGKPRQLSKTQTTTGASEAPQLLRQKRPLFSVQSELPAPLSIICWQNTVIASSRFFPWTKSCTNPENACSVTVGSRGRKNSRSTCRPRGQNRPTAKANKIKHAAVIIRRKSPFRVLIHFIGMAPPYSIR